MYGGDFDGAAAFSGGGFMPSQATQTADHPTSSSSTKSRDGHTLIPLTVNQISKALQSSDDKVNFLIDGVDVNNVKLVGMVLNRAERVTDVSFVLDDGTGRIDCNRWVNDPVDTKEMDAIREGMYVRVHGQLKGFQGKKQLVVFGINVSLITDLVQLVSFTLELGIDVDDEDDVNDFYFSLRGVRDKNLSMDAFDLLLIIQKDNTSDFFSTCSLAI
ncbi:replication protein A 32 kDa subunit B [Tanacetum coccineum]